RRREGWRRFGAGAEDPVAAFAADGAVMQVSGHAGERLSAASSIAQIGAQTLAAEALSRGRAAGDTTIGPLIFHRIGGDSGPILLATIGERSAPAPVVPESAPSEPAVAETNASQAERATPEPHVLTQAQTFGEPQDKSAVVAVTPAPLVVAESQDPMGASGVQPATDNTVAPVAPSDLISAVAPVTTSVPPASETSPSPERRHPLRFVWQIDAEGRFTIASDEFIELIGPRTAAGLARPRRELAATLRLDPEGQIERAIATRDTWSGLSASWPVDGTPERLTVELSGLPVFDRDRAFRGYRGFGVCRDLASVSELAH